jgi:hypothetical protein
MLVIKCYYGTTINSSADPIYWPPLCVYWVKYELR